MEKAYQYLYERLYHHFYYYCISGNDSEKGFIQNLETEVENTKNNNLMYIYQIIMYSEGKEKEKSKKLFFERIYEAESVITDPFDKWFYYKIAELSFTYVYPDAAKARENRCRHEECWDMLSSEEQLWGKEHTGKFNKADFKIRKHISNRRTMKDAYSMHLEERDFRLDKRSYLMILKGFSSSTPFFYSALKGGFYKSPIKGGGFFLKWRGYGLVIDPGINFMENMHQNGLSLKDINGIVVTHDHIDHNGDLMTIDDLASQFERTDIELFADKRTFKSSLQYDSWKDKIHMLDSIIKSGFTFGYKQDIKLEFMPTIHIAKERKYSRTEEEYENNVSFALKITLYENENVVRMLGFTSDTRYFPELSDFFTDCDIIIANMSETNEDDYRSDISDDYLKNNHLGYKGCRLLIEKCNENIKDTGKEPLYIISEFWAGKGDVRRELMRSLRFHTHCEHIVPGDIGMLFFLDQSTFLCEYCGCEEEVEKLHLLREKEEYGRILMICENCLL